MKKRLKDQGIETSPGYWNHFGTVRKIVSRRKTQSHLGRGCAPGLYRPLSQDKFCEEPSSSPNSLGRDQPFSSENSISPLPAAG